MADIVVVTGAGRGLGRAIADRFIAAGATVVGLDVQAPDDSPFPVIPVDITSQAAVEDAFDQIVADHGAPTICINAAGIYPRSKVADFAVDTFHRIFDVNVLGTWLVAAAFTARAGKGAVVLNVASLDGLHPEPKSLFYSASKAAVINLTAGMAGELAEQGIRVIGVAPAYIATDTVRALAGELTPDAADPADVAEAVWRLTRDGGIPLISGETVVVRARPTLDT